MAINSPKVFIGGRELTANTVTKELVTSWIART